MLRLSFFLSFYFLHESAIVLPRKCLSTKNNATHFLRKHQWQMICTSKLDFIFRWIHHSTAFPASFISLSVCISSFYLQPDRGHFVLTTSYITEPPFSILLCGWDCHCKHSQMCCLSFFFSPPRRISFKSISAWWTRSLARETK